MLYLYTVLQYIYIIYIYFIIICSIDDIWYIMMISITWCEHKCIKTHILHTDRHILVRETHWTSTAEDHCRTLDEDPGQCGRSQRGEHGHPARANCHEDADVFFFCWEYAALLCRSRVLKHMFKSEMGFMIFICTIQKHTTNPWNWFQHTTSTPTETGIFLQGTAWSPVSSVSRCIAACHQRIGNRDPKTSRDASWAIRWVFPGILLGRGHGWNGLKRWILGNCEENFSSSS